MKGRSAALTLVAGLALAAPACADDGCEGARVAGASKLVVQVHGVRSAKGEVAITVYPDDRRRFMAKGGKVVRLRLKAESTVRVCLWLPPANYEVAVYHDANGDRDFNRTMVGLPAEGFGFSNDPETRLGLPSISAARFRLTPGEGSVMIRMKYLR